MDKLKYQTDEKPRESFDFTTVTFVYICQNCTDELLLRYDYDELLISEISHITKTNFF